MQLHAAMFRMNTMPPESIRLTFYFQAAPCILFKVLFAHVDNSRPIRTY